MNEMDVKTRNALKQAELIFKLYEIRHSGPMILM